MKPKLRTPAAAMLAALTAPGGALHMPRAWVKKPREHEIKFTAEELAELRTLPPRAKKRAVAVLKEKYRRGE